MRRRGQPLPSATPQTHGQDADRCRRRADQLLSAGEAGHTASHLAGRAQACPLTTAQTGIAVCDRPQFSDYSCLLWAIWAPRLPTTAPSGPRNGVGTHLVRSSPGLGNRELTVCPSLACTLPSHSGGAKERAPAMPSIHVTGQIWPPIALLFNHRSVREPGPPLPLS